MLFSGIIRKIQAMAGRLCSEPGNKIRPREIKAREYGVVFSPQEE
jgi:hypothetical protein